MFKLLLRQFVLCLSEPLRRDEPSSYTKTWKDCGAFDTHFQFPWFSSSYSSIPFFVLLFPKGPGKIVMYFIPLSSSLTKDPLQFFITCVIRVLWLFRPFRRTSLVLIPWQAKSWKDCGAFDSHFQLPWPKILLMWDALPKLFLYPLSCSKWTLGGSFKKQFQSLTRWHS